MSNRRAIDFYQELIKLLALDKDEWEVSSGDFNRRLRNAILSAGNKEKIFLKYVFNYWQVQNQIRNTNHLNTSKINELNSQCSELMKEIFNEKESE